MSNILDVPQNFSTILNVPGGINNSQTTGIILTSVTNLPTDGGILCLDWNATLDSSVAEYIEYGGINGFELTGVIRGAESVFTAKAHSNGCTIVGVISKAHIKRLKDNFVAEHDRNTGVHNTTKVVDLTTAQTLTNKDLTSATNSLPTSLATLTGVQTLTNKTLTSPVINVTSDAQGDIYYRNASGAFTRLAPGTVGQVLRTGGAAANPTWVVASKAYNVVPTNSQTTTSTTYVDMAAGTVSVVLDVASNVYCTAQANGANSSAGSYCYIQITYDSGGADTIVGSEGHAPSPSASQEMSIAAGGVVVNLAAGTYTFALMKKVNGGTATYQQPNLQILVVPA